MDIDETPGEIKIKGRAEAERRKSKWNNDDQDQEMAPTESDPALERRESELKEKALRNKVMKSRKRGSSEAAS